MDTTLEFPSLSSTSWCGGLLDFDVGCVIFPNSGDSSATPASSSVAAVHLWPKVSTPSRSPRRFLSVLPFPWAFGDHSRLIPVFSFFPLCSVPVNRHGRVFPSSLLARARGPRLAFAAHTRVPAPHATQADSLSPATLGGSCGRSPSRMSPPLSSCRRPRFGHLRPPYRW
jgi:hypothetical protein